MTVAQPVITAAMLHLDEDMLSLMEQDLMFKAQQAYTGKNIAARVHGVFSLEDMEQKEASELGDNIAVGVGYLGCENGEATSSPQSSSRQLVNLTYRFLLLIAIPVANNDSPRYDALQLLTILRRGVAGKSIAGDRASRTWTLEGEAPRIAESTPEVLYYAQVWRVSLPNVAT